MKEVKRQHITNLLLILTGIFIPAGFDFLTTTLTRLIFLIFSLFFDPSIVYTICISLLFDLILLVGIVIAIMYARKLSEMNFPVRLQTFKKFGIITFILYLTNIIVNYLSSEQYDQAIEDYLMGEPIFFDHTYTQMYFIEFYSKLRTLLIYVLMFALYIRMVLISGKHESQDVGM